MRRLFPWLAALSLAAVAVLWIVGDDPFATQPLATAAQGQASGEDGSGDGLLPVAIPSPDRRPIAEGTEAVVEVDRTHAPPERGARAGDLARGARARDAPAAAGSSEAAQVSTGSKYGALESAEVQSGAIADTSVRGIVVDAAGSPLAGAMVVARDTHVSFLPDTPAVPTGSDGRFRVEELRAGEWEIEASAPGFERSRRTVQLPAEAGVELRIALRRAALVRGRVLAPDGSPIARAVVVGGHGWLDSFHFGGDTIWVFPPSRSPDDDWPEERPPRIEADAGGRFALPLDSGKVRIAAWAPDHAPSFPVDVGLEPGEERGGLELQLRPACRLSGSALDPQGRPLALWLTLQSSDGTRVSFVSGADGTFAANDLPGGRWKLGASDRGGHDGSLEVDLAPARATDVVLRLRALR